MGNKHFSLGHGFSSWKCPTLFYKHFISGTETLKRTHCEGRWGIYVFQKVVKMFESIYPFAKTANEEKQY